ncbi:MAG: uroporphyrinogen decarboxylase [Bacteroidota bacterium]|nr:uroporphyrinogen decarboxylase [Bacteroidota bacterium]
MTLQNDLLLRALNGEMTERPPVWVMRQAGRILPEYRAVRRRLSGFKELVETPELACEVTIQPVDLLGVDAAILFSDILVVPEAMGLPYELIEKVGPRFPETIGSAADLTRLHAVEPEEHLKYVMDAVRLTRSELGGRVPLIGFAGAPWTIFCYMVEGGGSKEWSRARRMLREAPELAEDLLDRITDATIVYLNAKIEAGVQAVQLFDSWAGALDRTLFERHSLPRLRRICESVKGAPMIVFAKGAGWQMDRLATLPCEALGVDWHMPVAEARQRAPEHVLQGNLDPSVLYGTEAEVRAATQQMLTDFGRGRHVANLGHGVYPDIHPDRVRAFIDEIQRSGDR